MNNKTKSDKFRVLSITALVTSILATIIAMWYGVLNLDSATNMLQDIIFISVAIGLTIAAVVCGSIDLKRIKAGRYSRKGRGFDITGIVLGVIAPFSPVIAFGIVAGIAALIY